MENSNAATGTGGQTTTTTSTRPPEASTDGKPDGPSANGTDRDVTLSVRCRITLRNGVALFGGAEDGGGLLGRPDGMDDLILEVEGTAGLSGNSTTFGGAADGGGGLGHADDEGQTQRRLYPARTNKGRRNGGAKAS